MQKGIGNKIMITDRQLYDNLTIALGNPYAAVMYIAKLARSLSKSCGYYISDSQAVEWAATGNQPKKVKVNLSNQIKVKLPIEEVLELVDDDEVVNAVLHSLRLSIENYLFKTNNTLYNRDNISDYSKEFMSKFIYNNHLTDDYLVFSYDKISDPNRKARVRILVKMIWNKHSCQ